MEKHSPDNTVRSVLLEQNLGVLATTGEKSPYTSLVGFVPTEDMKNIVFATMKQTRKYNNIKKHPRVSILVNSSVNRADDFKDAAAITIMGEVVSCSAEERKKMEDIYLKRFPFLEDFIKDPSCELLKVRVDKYVAVTSFQNVREIELS